jgi:serpin B
MSAKSLLTAGALATACLATLVTGCGSAAKPAGPRAITLHGVAAAEPLVNPAPYGADDLAFGLAALSRWCEQSPRTNILLSPASLASGLGMAYLGSRGSTAAAMRAVLHLPPLGSALEAGLQARMAAIRAIDRPGVTIADTDEVWTDPSLTTNSGFLNDLATGYGAGVGQVPLLSDPGKAASQINAAISAATHGQIRQLVSAQSVSNVGWLLTDAIYLHADWASPFESYDTAAGRFTTASGQVVRAQYLNGGYFGSASAAGWTAVSLPYRGGRLAMLALLPPAKTAGQAGDCQRLTPAILTDLRTGIGESKIPTGVQLPKVRLSSSASLVSLLRRLGMGIALGPNADFAGISPQAASIALIEQAATLRVDEKGTVASAATAVGVAPTAAEPARRIVVFNRPYLMLVLDTATGEPLFLARVVNPDLP